MNVIREHLPQVEPPSSFCATCVPASLKSRSKVSPEHRIKGEADDGHPLSVTAEPPPHSLNEHNENLTVSELVLDAV